MWLSGIYGSLGIGRSSRIKNPPSENSAANLEASCLKQFQPRAPIKLTIKISVWKKETSLAIFLIRAISSTKKINIANQ